MAVCKILKNVYLAWPFYFDFREIAIRKIPSLPLVFSSPILDNKFVHIFLKNRKEELHLFKQFYVKTLKIFMPLCNISKNIMKASKMSLQQIFCSKSTIETNEKGVKYVQT